MVSVDATTVAGPSSLPPLPDTAMIMDSYVIVDHMLLEFYTAVHYLETKEISQKEFDTVVATIAHRFASYQYIIIQGEMRHLEDKWVAERDSLIELGLDLGAYGSLNRHNFIKSKLVSGASREQTLALVERLANIFYGPYWQGSIGGKPWGDIAMLLLHYLHGEISPMLYVDRCFNIRHNCGRSFNKISQFCERALDDLLDARERGYVDLLHAVANNLLNGVQLLDDKQRALVGTTTMSAMPTPPPHEDEEEELDPEDYEPEEE